MWPQCGPLVVWCLIFKEYGGGGVELYFAFLNKGNATLDGSIRQLHDLASLTPKNNHFKI
jgi:hypothetical protein